MLAKLSIVCLENKWLLSCHLQLKPSLHALDGFSTPIHHYYIQATFEIQSVLGGERYNEDHHNKATSRSQLRCHMHLRLLPHWFVMKEFPSSLSLISIIHSSMVTLGMNGFGDLIPNVMCWDQSMVGCKKRSAHLIFWVHTTQVLPWSSPPYLPLCYVFIRHGNSLWIQIVLRWSEFVLEWYNVLEVYNCPVHPSNWNFTAYELVATSPPQP